jgi:predicted porin
MSKTKLMLTGAALGLVSVVAQAQSTEDLNRALAQAQAAATQAQEAARRAEAALEQARSAASQAQQSQTQAQQAQTQTQAAASALAVGHQPGQGVTVSSGASSVTLYGLIDITAFGRTNDNSAGKSVFSPEVAWFSGNRWGITGVHATGGPDDLNVIFKLESEFESQTGDMDTPGTLFNRDAWLGLESKSLGKLTFGRQNALARDPAASGAYGDPYGPARATLDEGGYTNNNNFKQLVFYAGSATGTRYDRGVVWKKDWGNLISGVGYQFGDVPGSLATGSTITGSLAYNGPNYLIAGFLTQANIASLTHRTASIGGGWQITPMWRVNTGYFHYTADQAPGMPQRVDDAWTVSTKITPEGKFDYELGYQNMHAKNAGLTSAGFVQNAYSDTSGVTAVATGNRPTVYASTFYHLDKQTEFYLAADYMSTTGGYLAAQAHGFTDQTEVGLGMRYKF